MVDIGDVVDATERRYGGREFNSEDFNSYEERLAPYWKKVFDRREMLTPSELEEIERIKDEIRSEYTAESISSSRIFGYTSKVLGYNNHLNNMEEEAELREEWSRLEKTLDEKRKEGILTDDEEAKTFSRINEILYTLDPWHFHGPEPKK